MLRRFRHRQPQIKLTGWRAYQAGLNQSRGKKPRIARTAVWVIALALVSVLLYGGMTGLGGSAAWRRPPAAEKPDGPEDSKGPSKNHQQLQKQDLKALLGSQALSDLTRREITFSCDGTALKAATSIDLDLQQYMIGQMDWRSDRYTPRYLGIVVMDPETGRILSMAGFDQENQLDNPCTTGRFPAASIFKIVTAAAAVETCDFTSDSRLTFNGRKYTLYKRQIKDRTTRYTNQISFKDSFAQSVNPVFGKIGALYLKKGPLAEYARSFGFNRSLDIEIPVAVSSVTLSDDPYQWAEVASGFNRETTLSPLHGAMLAAAVVNRGILIEPSLIQRVTDNRGQVLYVSRTTPIQQAMAPETAAVLMDLMKTTIRSGTCRKAFRGYTRDRVLSRLTIGGKTGSIYNKTREARFDWFVGFAAEKNGPGKIVLAVAVGHGKYIGTRASQYARRAMKEYFDGYFAHTRDPIKAQIQKQDSKG